MKYILEMELQSSNPAIIFHNVIFDTFKINIIERYSKYPDGRPLLCEAKFQMRSSDDRIFKKQNGDVTYNFRDPEFYHHKRSTKLINSCRQKKFIMM